MTAQSGALDAAAAESLVGLLEWRARESAEQRGYVFLLDGEQQEQRLSYGALCERARALGAVLAGRCPPGERALILLPPGAEFICAFFACMYAGLVAVPVPLPQRKRGLPRLLAVIADCQPRLALSTRELLDKTSAAAQLPLIDWLAVDDAPAAAAPLQQPKHTDAAFLQYTSGSTGTPKGVVLTHRNLLANERMIARAFEHGPESVIVGWLPPHHDMGLIGNLLQPLYIGADCIQMSPQHFLLRPARWLEAISRYRGTTSGGPNFAYDLCVEKIPARERAALDLSSWRVAFNGAEPVRAGTLERFTSAFAAAGFRRSAFYPCYGLAEASLLVSGGAVAAEPVVLAFERDALGRGHGEPALAAATAGAAILLTGSGRPAEGLQLEIVEPESGRSLPEGTVGEVWLRGASVAAGYWQAAEATRRVFGALTSTGAGPFLRTGDLGFLRAGELFITGRSKDLIVVRGRNVYPQDLELAAESSHELLRSGGACAFALEHGDAEHVVLVLEVPDGAEALPAVAGAARRAIAEQHEVALQAVVLVRTGALPRTTSGKLQRGSCREQLLAGSLPVVWDSRLEKESDGLEPPADDAAAQPRGALEQRLAELWCEVLGLRRIGRADIFLERGGDSLRALQLATRIEEQLGVPLPATLLFESCSVASLASWLESHPAEARGSRVAPESALQQAEFPLSATQERMWFLEQLAEGAPIHHLALALTLQGELRREALQRAIAQLVARHAALRTRFVVVEGRPLQRVEAPAAEWTGLTVVALEAPRQTLDECLRQQVRRPFLLDAAPPVRWTLVQCAAQEHVLVLTCHHLLADGWSLNLLLRELCVIYAAELTASTPALPPVVASYADYVLWQTRPERAAGQEQARAFWLERLRGLESSELPGDRPRPAIQSYCGGRLELRLEPALLARLDAAGRRAGATLFSTLATALFALVYRATGQADLCLGTPLFDRGRRAFEQLVGCCVNTLALRVEVTGELTLAELGARVLGAVREGLAHGDLPFERVLAALPSRRDPSRSPLFQVMLTLQPELGSLPAVPGLALGVRQLGTDTAQFDLAIDVARDGDAARVAWEYNRELFDAETVQGYWARFCCLLEALCTDPAQRVSAVDLRLDNERAQVRPERDSGRHPSGPPPGVLQRVAHWVATQPAAPALQQDGVCWSYGELGRRTEQLARLLRRAGVGPEARVALHLPSSPQMVAAALGVLRAGGAYVPLELQQPASRLAQVLLDADVRWIISERALVSGLPESSAQLVLLDELPPDAESIGEPLPEVDPEQLGYVLFTSGSTGKPKGVLVSHGMLAATCRGWEQLYRWGSMPPRVLGVSNPAFDVWSADWLRALCSGGCLVFAGADVLLDPRALSELIAAQQIALIDLVPSVLRPLLAYWQSEAGRCAVAEHVRVFIVGSEAWSRSEYRALRAVLPPRTRLLSCYGVTEATIDSAWFEAADAGAPAGEGSVPLGVALSGSQLYVLDRDGVELPPGLPGELAIGGRGVARGYVARARWTAERFRPDPFSNEPGARLYLSGDRVRRARDGNLEFLGRRDQQLKLRGRRVEPAEIERQLLAHPAIAACAVALWQRSGSEPLLVAYLVPAAQRLGSAELRSELRAHLPEVLLPGRIVWLEALPLNANGKLDRARLPEPGEEAATSPPAASELEQRIAAIWQEALGLARVGRHDNFFDLGGHSLLLTRVLGRLRAEVRPELAMVTLFRHPTVATLAEALAAPEPAVARAAPAASEEEVAERRRELRARRRRSLEQDK